MRRYFTTRPTRLTAAFAAIALVSVAVSFLVPGTPAHHFREAGHRVTEHPLGWQEALIGALRIGGVIVAIIAFLRHQRTVETVDDMIREEAATIPYDRSAGVDARGNTRVRSEPARRR